MDNRFSRICGSDDAGVVVWFDLVRPLCSGVCTTGLIIGYDETTSRGGVRLTRKWLLGDGRGLLIWILPPITRLATFLCLLRAKMKPPHIGKSFSSVGEHGPSSLCPDVASEHENKAGGTWWFQSQPRVFLASDVESVGPSFYRDDLNRRKITDLFGPLLH